MWPVNLKLKNVLRWGQTMIVIGLLGFVVLLGGCRKANLEKGKTISLKFSNMPKLTTGFFALWVKRDQVDKRLRQFLVNEDEQMTDIRNRKELSQDIGLPENLFSYQEIFVTVESQKNFNQAYKPSKSVILTARIIPGESPRLTFTNLNLSAISGQYYLHNYSDSRPDTTGSGVWFANLINGQTSKGLTLPPASIGWIYEGWISKNGLYISTGQFGGAEESDLQFNYSAGRPVIAYAGEDFMFDPPPGFTFPLILNDGRSTLTISIQPFLEIGSFPEKKPTIPILTAKVPENLTPDLVQPLEVLNNALPEATVTLP